MADGSQALTAPAKPLNSRQKRQLMEAALERLLGAVEGVLADLDALDGDADLEPSLGFPERYRWPFTYRGHRAEGAQDDREVVCEDEGAETGDDEYELGWAEIESQNASAGFCASGLPSDGREANLGASDAIDQTRWGHDQESWDRDSDREEQCEDEGGACEDEGQDPDREPDLGWSTFGNQGPRVGEDAQAVANAMMGDYLSFDFDRT